MKTGGQSVSKLKKKTWKIFSEYIRRRDCGVCFSCGQKGNWKEMDAGHYWSRRYNNTLFNERNVHCQCKKCNIWNEGNKPAYTIRLIATYGQEIIDELNSERLKEKHFTTRELMELMEYYKQCLKSLLK